MGLSLYSAYDYMESDSLLPNVECFRLRFFFHVKFLWQTFGIWSKSTRLLAKINIQLTDEQGYAGYQVLDRPHGRRVRRRLLAFDV